MIVYLCRDCGSDIRAEDLDNSREFKEVLLINPCDYCKLILKEGSEILELSSNTVLGGIN